MDTVFPPPHSQSPSRQNRMSAPGIAETARSRLSRRASLFRFTKPRQPQRTHFFFFRRRLRLRRRRDLRGCAALVTPISIASKPVVMERRRHRPCHNESSPSRRSEPSSACPGGPQLVILRGIPNPITALVSRFRAFSFSTARPRKSAHHIQSTPNRGGTSVNSIPHEAARKVDILLQNETKLLRLETLSANVWLREWARRNGIRSRSLQRQLGMKWTFAASPVGDSRRLAATAALLAADDYTANYIAPRTRFHLTPTPPLGRRSTLLPSAHAATSAARIRVRM